VGRLDLAERGRRERVLVEGGKALREGRAELSLRQAPDRAEVFRRHLVLQPRQLGGDLVGQDVEARREELADLDEHAAHAPGQGAESRGQAAQARGSGAPDRTSQADQREEQLPQDQRAERPREEQDDSYVARAEHDV
jgi:hypothetical protein